MNNQKQKVYSTFSKTDYDFFKRKNIPLERIKPTHLAVRNDNGELTLIKNPNKDGN